ncbi:hypothetical protein [Defluviicoccus vanus]|uniref:Lipoprotein n=1 Tax=Defluviicoccus vanus TaxID=111831 RepID=A0A7H1MXP9_9PROT|nr:hypothetical protein [Defluviicoccus vanus]QNT68235.1 hypothetical protein HQ394_01205 [Defluviicoccus vanus]
MRLSRLIAAGLILAFVGAMPPGACVHTRPESGNNADGTPRFADPDASTEKMTDQQHSSGVFFGGSANRSGYPASDIGSSSRPMPSGAQIGAGDHGFNNYTRYGR